MTGPPVETPEEADPETLRRWRAALRSLLPSQAAVAVWGVDTRDSALLSEEEEAVARSVPRRRREFARGRASARAALEALGARPTSIPVGLGRAPVWPRGFLGSITHAGGLAAAAVARRTALACLGIDAEAAGVLEPAVQEMIFAPGEDRGTEPWWPALVFSAKESVYKALHPAVRAWIPFEAVRVAPGRGEGRLDVRSTGWTLPDGRPLPLAGLRGAWAREAGCVLTAFWKEVR